MTPADIKNKLLRAIAEALSTKEDYSPKSSKRSRKRKLPLERVFLLLLTMTGGSLKRELRSSGNGGAVASASAFCQRRAQLSPTAVEKTFYDFNALCPDSTTYKGYRLFAVDGTSVNMARNEKSPTFIQDGNRGYSAFKVTAMYDIMAHTYFAACVKPQTRQDEICDLLFMLAWYDLDRPSIIIGDRLYASFNTLATIRKTPNADYVIRAKDALSPSAMRPVKWLAEKHSYGEFDDDVSFEITTSQTNEDKAAGRIFLQTGSKKGKENSAKTRITRWDFSSPYAMTYRVVRYRFHEDGKFYTLVTSLPRDRFSKEEIIELYHRRWAVELAFRTLKYSIGLSNLHSRKDDYVRQEIWAALTMQNFCSRIVAQAVIEKKDTKHEYAVDFKLAVPLCKAFLSDVNSDEVKLLREIAQNTEPIRYDRHSERNLRAKGFSGFCYRIAA